MTPSDLDEMIEEIDIDGSGTVDWEGKFRTKLTIEIMRIVIFPEGRLFLIYSC